MDITSLIEQDGITLRREAGTNGGEMAGGCPFCGGRDRFRVWPEKGRYWCRQCGARGDSIQYLRDKHGMTYHAAREALGIEENTSSPARQKEKPDGWLNTDWQAGAWAFLGEAMRSLQWNEAAREYLKGRGLNDETISGLGWNGATTWANRETWGLPTEVNTETGALKRLWLPKGIVIPTIDGGLIHRLRIRLSLDEFEKSKAWAGGGKGIRYMEVSGSGGNPLSLPGREGAEAWAVFESELDALLIHQEAGDLVNVLGLGSAQAKPPAGILKRLSGARVLVCLDFDDAGWKAARGFWSGTGEYWPVPSGKDPGDYFQAGGSIRAWIGAGLKPAGIPDKGHKEPEDLQTDPKEIIESAASQEAGGAACNDDTEEITSSEGLSLPCENPKIRCFHLRGEQCFYKSNWGPVSELGACPMIVGLGLGEAHPTLEQLYKQRRSELCL